VHGLLYGVLVFMPISGLAFGYLSGWGVPFFKWNVPGASKEAAESAVQQEVGEVLLRESPPRRQLLTWYLFPIHLGGLAFTYFVRGHSLFTRMLPWRK
jgi:cytochrome b561